MGIFTRQCMYPEVTLTFARYGRSSGGNSTMIARRVIAGAAVASLVAAAVAAADLLLVGSELQINETTALSQVGTRARAAAVARDEAVIVWQSDDGDGNGIFARRIDDLGLSSEFPVN